MERPFGRGPTTLLKRDLQQLTMVIDHLYTSPGMILQVLCVFSKIMEPETPIYLYNGFLGGPLILTHPIIASWVGRSNGFCHNAPPNSESQRHLDHALPPQHRQRPPKKSLLEKKGRKGYHFLPPPQKKQNKNMDVIWMSRVVPLFFPSYPYCHTMGSPSDFSTMGPS